MKKSRLIPLLVPAIAVSMAAAVIALGLLFEGAAPADSLAEALRNPDAVEELDLQGLRLTGLPPAIGKLKNLRALYLYGNRLESFPPEIGELESLQGLFAPENRLAALPPEIGRLTGLVHLELYGNRLTTLPPEIGQLKNLRVLNLNQNRLEHLPAEIGSLAGLQQLDLRANQRLPEAEVARARRLLPGATVLSGPLVQARDLLRK